MRRAPEVVPYGDMEGGELSGKLTSLQRVPPPIIPFQMPAHSGRTPAIGSSHKYGSNDDGTKNLYLLGACWLVGWLFLGYDFLWPIYMAWSIFTTVLSYPPLSWIFGGWFSRGAPVLAGGAFAEEVQVGPSQVSQYLDTYVKQYGDGALIFSAFDGLPQIVRSLLNTEELGYADLINARDDSGNTALLYTASKGFRQCAAALLHAGANPNLPNVGGGSRTPLMEASGGGFRDIIAALRLAPNMTSIDAVDDSGNSALHYAAYHGHTSAVLELLKSNPDKDLKNKYSQTPASYAATNRHKSVSDLLMRSSSRSAKSPSKTDDAHERLSQEHLQQLIHDARTKGIDKADLGPTTGSHLAENERKALEDQLAKMKREHEEADLKAQRKLVDLMEKNAELQRTVDQSKEAERRLQYNNTEMTFKISELETKYRSSELRYQEEEQRVKSLREDVRRLQDEALRQREERTAQQQRELTERHARLTQNDEEHRRQQDEIDRLHRDLQELRSGHVSAVSSKSTESAIASASNDTYPEGTKLEPTALYAGVSKHHEQHQAEVLPKVAQPHTGEGMGQEALDPLLASGHFET